MNQHGTSRVPFFGRCPECGSVEALVMGPIIAQRCLACGEPFGTTSRCRSWPRFRPVALWAGRAAMPGYACEGATSAATANERFAARKAALAAAKEAVAAAYATLRDAPLGELSRRNDELIAADAAYKRLLREE